MTTTSQARAHRRDLDELVRLAQNDLRATFARHDDPEATRDALLVVMPRLIAVYGAAAATLAADWYDDLRDAEGLRGSRYIAAPAELPDDGRAETLARWGVGPLFAVIPDKATAYSKTSGGLQRIVADAARTTITQSSTDDPNATGWVRVTSGGCQWCESIAGARTGPTFRSHDGCGCVAAPAWR